MANPPFNLFDVLLALVLVGGILHGRKHGLSAELLSTAKWVTLLLVCAVTYRAAGTLVASTGLFDLLTCYLFCYLGTALAVFLIFSVLERRLAPKLVGSDIFGRSEYFLGMGFGLVRFTSMVFVGLALLNAREFSRFELVKDQKYRKTITAATFSQGFTACKPLCSSARSRVLSSKTISDSCSSSLPRPMRRP